MLPQLASDLASTIALASRSIPHDAYSVLKAFGHSPAKAAEIVLDARRGDLFCQKWIEHARAALTRGQGE